MTCIVRKGGIKVPVGNVRFRSDAEIGPFVSGMIRCSRIRVRNRKGTRML